MRLFSTIVAIFLMTSFTAFASNASLLNFNQTADAFFKKYVKNGKVDYKTLKSNFIEVDQLYRQLATVDLSNTEKTEQMAFYINAYNIVVIRQITDFYPLKSAMDKIGFFNQLKHQVAGEELTLDQIEKGKVIIPFRDARVHFAFSCAAIGCPELGNFAYTAQNLEAKLDERTRNSINNPEFIIVDDANKEVKLSMIFKWYQNDFKSGDGSVIDYINKYRKQPIPASYQVSHYAYNWGLNIQ